MNTITDLLSSSARPLFSFEFFPPKDEAGHEQLWRTIEHLTPLSPDFVSVTYGANGSSRDRTLAVTRRLVTQTSLRTMGHLTCASQSRDDLVRVIEEYAAEGVSHIFAIRGDMPGGPAVPWEPHPRGLSNATQLVELVKSRGDFCVGVAAFPDGHPSRFDVELDARILRDKWRAGASFAITQLFFDIGDYVRLVDRTRSIGCEIPIIAGIMPITLISQVKRFAEMSGAPIPESIVRRLDEVADDAVAVRRVGTQIGWELSQELLDAGAPGLHFFTQNRSMATRAIAERLHTP